MSCTRKCFHSYDPSGEEQKPLTLFRSQCAKKNYVKVVIRGTPVSLFFLFNTGKTISSFFFFFLTLGLHNILI